MSPNMLFDDTEQPHLTTIEVDGRRYHVSVRVTYDGIEYVGRLWFADELRGDGGTPDRGAIPGQTREEVVIRARRLTEHEMILRFRRAQSEIRRYGALRKATDEILIRIRYLNQLTISMRARMLEADGAAQEIELTQRQLHDLIARLHETAGVEDE